MIEKSPLLPDRYPQGDLFICDAMECTLKDDQASMEHPFFALSSKTDTQIRRYENGKKWLEVTPSMKGMPTIMDKDLLIYATSKIMAAMNSGSLEDVPYRITFSPIDMMKFTNRMVGGRQYENLLVSLERLKGVVITTNISEVGTYRGKGTITKGFGLINDFEIHRGDKRQVINISIRLSDWLLNQIIRKQVLTLHRDYFRLGKPIERRIYEIARKHCGADGVGIWQIGLSKLQEKCVFRGRSVDFRRKIRGIAETNHLPDYDLVYADDLVKFYRRGSMEAAYTDPPEASNKLLLTPNMQERLKPKLPRSHDFQGLIDEWQQWGLGKGIVPVEVRDPEAHFMSFAKGFIKNNS